MWSLYESSRKNNVLWYERKMKDWRKARRQWEISLLENKYYVKKNYDLFRPRLTIGTVPAAIALGKEDNRREELALFNTGYTGEPPTSQKKMKAIGSGKGKTLVTDSEESDEVNEVDEVKVRRRIEKKMMLDKDEEEDIEELILGYSKGLGKTLADPASNNPEDIKKGLDKELEHIKAFDFQALKEIEEQRKLYPELEAATKVATANVRDTNGSIFDDWAEGEQIRFVKEYRKRNIKRLMKGLPAEVINRPPPRQVSKGTRSEKASKFVSVLPRGNILTKDYGAIWQ